MIKSILNLAWKEVLQLLRDRVLLAFLVILPVSQLFLIAEATGAGVRGVRLAVWDQDKSPLSQELISAIGHTEEFQLAYRAASFEEIHALLDQGNASIAVIIPPNLTREALKSGGNAVITVLVDGTNVIVAGNLLSTLETVVADLTLKSLESSMTVRLPAGIDIKVDAAFNPTLNFRWSTLPSQLAFVTYQLVLVVAAVGLVRERELGTMEQLVVTPISRLELVLGKGLIATLIGLANFFILILLLSWGFKIPMRGDPVLLFGLGLLFIITEIGWGTLVSIVTTSQQQAILIVFLLAMLELTFSGYLVPTDNMPAAMRLVAEFSPLQHFTAIVRSVYIKGSTLPMLMTHVNALALLAVGTTTLAWVLFSRTTDL